MPYSFEPKPLLSIFCVLLIIIFSALGVWQLQRADEKQKTQAQLQSLSNKTALDLNKPTSELQASSKAEAKGRYISDDQFLLDNIVHQGKPGYYLLSPFLLNNSEEVVLVNRGWLPKQTNTLPKFETPEQEVVLKGTLAPPRSKPVVLGGVDHPISDTPPLWYYMDIEFFETNTGYQVLPLVLRLAPDNNSPFVRDWPKYQAKSGMHIGYAIQWFVFAFFVLIALASINIKISSRPDKNNTKNNER